MVQYFLSFAFNDNGMLNVCNACVSSDKGLNDPKSIEALHDALKEKGFITPIVLFFTETNRVCEVKPDIREFRVLGEKEARRIMEE